MIRPSTSALAIAIMLAAFIGLLYATLTPESGAMPHLVTPTPPTPIPTATPPPTPTPTPIPPPVPADQPAVRGVWLAYDDASPCSTQTSPIDPVYFTQGGCEPTAAMIDAGEASALGMGLAHLPACPASVSQRGRYMLLSPADESGVNEYPAPLSVTLDGLDQRGAFVPQARVVTYHGITYRAYVTAYESNCRALANAELRIEPHPLPTPTPTPTPTLTPTPGP